MSSPTPDLFDSHPAPAAAGLALVPPGAEGASRRMARELWLCLLLPRLPLEALTDGKTGTDREVCVVEGAGSKQRVAAVSEAAARHGVRPGLGLNAALALRPQLELLERRLPAEITLLRRLAQWANQFTPLVSMEPPQALLAEVRGSLGLFGGAEALRRLAAQQLGGFGLHSIATLAPTPRAALWLARASHQVAVESLDEMPAVASRLPLDCLGWPQPVTRTLVTLGARTIADLARLPRDGFARRFGPVLLGELDEGFGRRPQPRRRAIRPERFDDSLELPAESASTRLVGIALERLLERLQAFLRSRAAGTRGLVIELRHRGIPATRFRLGLARPSGDGRHLLALLRARLDRLPLPAPVLSLRMRSTVITPLEPRAGLLPGGADCEADPEAAARLLERLRARLGDDAVFSVCLVPEHRPEFAWRVAEPSLQDREKREERGRFPFPQATEKGSVPFLAPRPLWMLAEPQPLVQHGGLPWHDGSPLELTSGPERIETGWWDGRDVRRDYHVATGRGGVRLWVYRERSRAGGWWLHGVFG